MKNIVTLIKEEHPATTLHIDTVYNSYSAKNVNYFYILTKDKKE